MPWYGWILNKVISVYHLSPLLRNFASEMLCHLLVVESHLLFCLVSHLFAYTIPATAIRGLTEFTSFSIGVGRAKMTVRHGNMLPAHLSNMESAYTKWHYFSYIQAHRSGFFLWTKQEIALWLRYWAKGKTQIWFSTTEKKETGFIPQPSSAELLPLWGYCSV